MARLQPLEDRLVVKPSVAEEKTAGGIVLPDSAKEKPVTGTVVTVGAGKLLDNGQRAKMLVKPNDVVYYGKYSGTEVTIANEKFVLLRESDVLAVKVG